MIHFWYSIIRLEIIFQQKNYHISEIRLSLLGESGVVLNFIHFFDEFSLSKQNSPRCDAAYCGVTSGAILFAYVPQKECQAYELIRVYLYCIGVTSGAILFAYVPQKECQAYMYELIWVYLYCKMLYTCHPRCPLHPVLSITLINQVSMYTIFVGSYNIRKL